MIIRYMKDNLARPLTFLPLLSAARQDEFHAAEEGDTAAGISMHEGAIDGWWPIFYMLVT